MRERLINDSNEPTATGSNSGRSAVETSTETRTETSTETIRHSDTEDARSSHTYFRRVDQLISQTLSDGLDVLERRLTSTGAQQPD